MPDGDKRDGNDMREPAAEEAEEAEENRQCVKKRGEADGGGTGDGRGTGPAGMNDAAPGDGRGRGAAEADAANVAAPGWADGAEVGSVGEPDAGDVRVKTKVVPFRRGSGPANRTSVPADRFSGTADGRDVPEGEWREDEDGGGFDGEDGDSAKPRFPSWIRRMIVALIVISLAAQAAAILPRIYNADVIGLLAETRNLSRDERMKAYKSAIVVVEAGDRKGTGFNVGEQGLVVTNRHVIGESPGVVVGFEDGRVFHARVVAEDEDADLALLAPDGKREETYPTLALDASNSWAPGDEVYYIGNPLFFRHIAGRGTVLGWADAGRSFPVLLIEAPVYPGNSGSPVISGDGRVIGVIYASTELDIGGRRAKAGLAIPASHPFLAGIRFADPNAGS